MTQNRAILASLETILTTIQTIYEDMNQLTKRISASKLRADTLTQAFERGDKSDQQRAVFERDLAECQQLMVELEKRMVECDRRRALVRELVLSVRAQTGLDWPLGPDS